MLSAIELLGEVRNWWIRRAGLRPPELADENQVQSSVLALLFCQE